MNLGVLISRPRLQPRRHPRRHRGRRLPAEGRARPLQQGRRAPASIARAKARRPDARHRRTAPTPTATPSTPPSSTRSARPASTCVVLAGFMRLLTPRLPRRLPDRVVNIHPALLPAFPGVDAQAQALAYGARVTGCTVHFVDAGTDTGPVIAQAVVPVLRRRRPRRARGAHPPARARAARARARVDRGGARRGRPAGAPGGRATVRVRGEARLRSASTGAGRAVTTKHFDVIVLGRSIGALTAAALLARRDFTVLVLGQGERAPTYRLDRRTLLRRVVHPARGDVAHVAQGRRRAGAVADVEAPGRARVADDAGPRAAPPHRRAAGHGALRARDRPRVPRAAPPGRRALRRARRA